MTNWKSKTSEYTPIKKSSTIIKANIAIDMRIEGHSVAYIAKHMGLSKSRIYEYLRKDVIPSPKPPTRQFHI